MTGEKFLMKKVLFGLALMTAVWGAGNTLESYAAPSVISESAATEKSRVSYLMNGTDGKMYHLYIVGEGEKFYGSKATWKQTDYDQLYCAVSYWAYISDMNDSNAILQDVNLFGKKSSNHPEYINRTDPTYVGGIYIMKGVQGQPDILVSASQSSASYVDYRFFVIQNGNLRPMKFMSDTSQETRTATMGTHRKPYEKEDGTVACPWFRRKDMVRDGTPIPGGNFVSVYMPDFTNLILIPAYTYKE